MDIQSILRRELKLPKSQNFFLFGARATGKTTLVRELFKENIVEYNLLQSEEYRRLVARPELLREEVNSLSASTETVFIDEIQRAPELLNEVQYLIDKKVPQSFILSGSSSRKLLRGKGNLLAGRAWNYKLYPFTLFEIGEKYSLQDILSYGLLPKNVLAQKIDAKEKNLKSYIDVYLKEEIEAEALTRNIGGFIRFLSVAAQTNGEQLNYSNIARDVNISDATVKEYFKILEDTLIGFFLMPFSFSERKRHKLSPKFYFFDTGVLRGLQKRLKTPLQVKTFEYGNYFETFIINELMKISSYHDLDLSFSFLRTANDVEVDLVIEKPNGEIFGIEIKSKETPQEQDFSSGFKAFKKLVPKAKCFCVCTAKRSRKIGEYDILPYRDFLTMVRSW